MKTPVLTILTVLALSACVAQGPATDGAASLQATAAAFANIDASVAQARADAGRAPVTSNARLDAVARAHANDMTARGYFAHTTPDGVRFTDRLRAAGIRSCAAAENIAFGQTTEAAAMASWLSSAAHRANILNPNVTSYGVGRSGNNWVMVLVRPC